MRKIDRAVQIMCDIAKDDKHGYDWTYRWGEYGDYDCSSLTIHSFKKAGFNLDGATYTGNLKSVLIREGFKDVKASKECLSGFKIDWKKLLPGDILLNELNHVAVYVGEGLLVEASINEKGGVRGGKPGDQTGREIAINPYRNYRFGWDCVMRAPENLKIVKKVEKKVERKGDDEVVKDVKVIVDYNDMKKDKVVNAVFKDGHYYIKARDLTELGLIQGVGWDSGEKAIILVK